MKSGARTLALCLTALSAVCLGALSLASAQTFTITAKSTSGGTISPVGKVVVAAGGSQTFTMVPDLGHEITAVVADKVAQGIVTSYTFNNVQKSTSIKATFKIQSFNITTSATGGLKISPAGSKTYKYGKSATIKVTPPKGSTQVPILTQDGVPVALVQSGKSWNYAFTVTAAHTFAASFAPQNSVTVSRAGTGGGTVTSVPAGISCSPTCSASFNTGSMVTLTATPDANSTFAGWSGDCTGTVPCVLTLSADAAATATFTAIQHTLTVTPAGTGTGTVTSSPAGINCGATCTSLFNQGTVVTLTPAATAGSTFAGWSGGGCSGTGNCLVTLGADTTVTATFNISTVVQHTLTVVPAGTGLGTVTSNPAGIDCGFTCSSLFDEATVITLTAVPSGGSTFAGWSGSGCSGTAPCPVTLSADKSVTATFTTSGGGGGLMLHITDFCGTAAVGAIVAVHNTNGTVLQKITTGATGIVDLSSFGSAATFTVGWPNSMSIPDASIQSFVSVPTNLGTFTVALEGGSCPLIDPTLGSVTVNLTPDPGFASVQPLGTWITNARSLTVHQSALQSDSKLTLLADDSLTGSGPVGYGFLLDQTFTNGATYNMNLNLTSTGIAFSAGDDLSSISIEGVRKGVFYSLSPFLSLTPPVMSGTLEFFNQFAATSWNVSASAPFAFDTFGFPSSFSTWTRTLSAAPASVTIPAIFHVSSLMYNSGTVTSSWVLSNSSAGKIGVVGFSNTLVADDRHWTIALDPTTHSSWSESDLTLPTELSLAGRTAGGPSMIGYDFSYISTYANGLKALYGTGVTPPAPPYDFAFAFIVP